MACKCGIGEKDQKPRPSIEYVLFRRHSAPLLDRPAPLLLDRLIDLFCQAYCLAQGCYDALVVLDIAEFQPPPFSVFEPLLCYLISADVELPGLRRDSLKILRLVDPDLALLRLTGGGGIFYLFHPLVSSPWAACGDFAHLLHLRHCSHALAPSTTRTKN